MYNSIFIGLIMKITRSLQKMYKNSLIHRMFSTIDRYIRIIYRGSLINRINKNNEMVFKNSLVYIGVGKLFKIFDVVLDFLKDFVNKISTGSILTDDLKYYSRSISSGLRLFYKTFVILGVVLILGNLLGHKGLPIGFSAILVILGILGIFLNGLEVIALKESSIINFFLDLFKEDEGGENWW